MMEGQNLGADTRISDMSQPIGDGSTVVGGLVDVVVAVADGGVKTELGRRGGVLARKKRGRPPKAQVKLSPAKKNKEVVVQEEEDVCFICFDGGSLVLCDRRNCPKAYHPACIKRDEAFFQSAAKWNCGWHICSMCEKPSHHMCYTCTYSLCKGCIRKSDYVCVRGDKGFCTICMKTIMLIENNGQGEDGKVQADFDDKLSWEYLFKVYWVYLKGKLSLTLDELTQANNPWKIATPISIPPPLPSPNVHNKPNDPTIITPSTSIETNESKRRKISDQIDNPPPETVNTEKSTEKPAKPAIDEVLTMVESKDWATKELLDFVSHMKNGNTSVLSRSDVQELLMEYIKRNNLRDPKKKNQITCDSRLKNLFGKPRVGHMEMLTHLEYHFFVEEDLSLKNSSAVLDYPDPDPDWTNENIPVTGKDKKRRKRSKGEEREHGVVQNKLDEFAAVDVHNMNLIYLRRDLMVKLVEDSVNFHGRVVGSIVRIRISGSDQKHDVYRLVQVVGTSKVDVPYKIDTKLADFMLEVLNLDKEETISIDTISDQEISEEECRRLQQSMRCGLVKRFTVGEIQDKAVALQPVRLDDWMEKEILRLSHLRDVASEKGHRKGYRECVEKLQLLKALDERERRLQEIPEVHSDPKMNPDYESDDTEEYFNKEHASNLIGDHMESKYSVVTSKNSRSPKKKAVISIDTLDRPKKTEQPIAIHPNLKEGSLVKSESKIDCNNSTITKSDHNQHQAAISSSVSNNPPEPITALKNAFSPNDTIWHYFDPNGKVQGPFSMVQLQRWSTTGYFPVDMRVWANHKDKSVLLNDLLKEHFGTHIPPANKDSKSQHQSQSQTEGTAIPTIQSPPVPVNQEKLSDGLSGHGQNWNANANADANVDVNIDANANANGNGDGDNSLDFNNPSVVSLTMSNESTGNRTGMEQAVTVSKDTGTPVIDLPGPSPKKASNVDENIQLDSGVLIPPESGNPASWSSASSLVVGGGKISVSGVKVVDHVATPTSNIDQNIDQIIEQNNIDQNALASQANNDLPTWHGMGEMIEFSTLAEESVSDLLAEVDAMESQYGLPSPTSRRNSFVDDLFNGSFDEFSPTPDQGTRSDGFSSSGDIQLPCQDEQQHHHQHLVGFDFMKMQQNPFIAPTESHPASIGGFKWPEMERAGNMIDINRSANDMDTDRGGSRLRYGGVVQPAMPAPKTPEEEEEEDGEFLRPDALQPPFPPAAPPLTLGLDPFDSDKSSHSGRYNSSSNNRSSRSSWNKQGGGGGGGDGGYSRPPTKGQRVCRFYESGRCKKGSSCKYLHP